MLKNCEVDMLESLMRNLPNGVEGLRSLSLNTVKMLEHVIRHNQNYKSKINKMIEMTEDAILGAGPILNVIYRVVKLINDDRIINSDGMSEISNDFDKHLFIDASSLDSKCDLLENITSLKSEFESGRDGLLYELEKYMNANTVLTMGSDITKAVNIGQDIDQTGSARAWDLFSLVERAQIVVVPAIEIRRDGRFTAQPFTTPLVHAARLFNKTVIVYAYNFQIAQAGSGSCPYFEETCLRNYYGDYRYVTPMTETISGDFVDYFITPSGAYSPSMMQQHCFEIFGPSNVDL